MTQTCSLAILTSFLFLRLHYILKLVIGIVIVVFYSWNVWIYRSNLFQVILISIFYLLDGINCDFFVILFVICFSQATDGIHI